MINARVWCVSAVVNGRSAVHLDTRTCHRGHAAASGTTSRADRRRRDWVDRKQKSKSFDFCWQSGMWSPIDRPAADVMGGQASLPPPPAAPLLSVPPVTAVVPVAVPAAPPPVTAEREADECRRSSPRLKLPPMFHMDSGSSFESYEPGDGLLQHQLLQVVARDWLIILSCCRQCFEGLTHLAHCSQNSYTNSGIR